MLIDGFASKEIKAPSNKVLLMDGNVSKISLRLASSYGRTCSVTETATKQHMLIHMAFATWEAGIVNVYRWAHVCVPIIKNKHWFAIKIKSR